MGYRYRLATDLSKIDTTVHKQDSIVITHLSRDGKAIRQEVFRLNDKGCKTYHTDRYFDKDGRLAYIEYWDLACIEREQKGPETKLFTGLMQKYERLQYDDDNRLIIRIFYDNHVGARRIIYSYSKTGNSTLKMKRIKEYEFWN
jgi:hypothetical protein